MCGIAGIITKNQLNLPLLEEAKCLLKNRGPDETNSINFSFNNINFYLLHSRLSIQDTSPRSRQPFSCRDSRSLLVYNGEIYNHDRLLPGHTFYSDTHALFSVLENNIDLLKYLDGFYAFGFFDRTKSKFFLGRDRFGIKPLFYYYNKDTIAFSSSLRYLHKVLKSRVLISDRYIIQVSCLGYSHDSTTLYEGISKLHPNTLLEISLPSFYSKSTTINGKFSHDLQSNFSRKASAYYNQLVTEAFADSINLQLQHSQRGSSIFLSGGVDSAMVSAFAIKSGLPDQNLINCFSVTSSTPTVDESNRISKLLAFPHFATINSRSFELNSEELLMILNKYPSLDYPVLDISILPTILLCSSIPQSIRVCLSGDGADELFLGYSRLWSSQKIYNLSKLCPFLSLFNSQKYSKYLLATSVLDARFLTSGVPAKFLPYCRLGYSSESDLSILLDYEITHYLPSVLEKVDAASMLNGLEVRVPFLSNNIVDIVSKIPISHLGTQSSPKRILKNILQDFTDDSYPYASKKGFNLSPDLISFSIRYLETFAYPTIHPKETELSTSPAARLRILLLKHWIFNNP